MGKSGYTEREIREKILPHFETEGTVRELLPWGNGHINHTWKVTSRTGDGRENQYLLQQINTDIFKNPGELMENIERVTAFLKEKICGNGGDPLRETLNVIRTENGESFLRDEKGCFRIYRFIEDAVCLEAVRTPEDFYKSALAFGDFQRMLSDFPAASLHETIPNFHNTPSRYADFIRAVKEDAAGRAGEVAEEIHFIMKREADTHILCDCLAAGRIPLRVTHNDTKLNNVLFDSRTGKCLCVIDLDTVMPGSALYDFGDSIRFGASTGAEDEKDLSRIECDLELFEIYAKGFLEGCGGSLTEQEIRMLPEGAKLMTLECGMRFLADYLQGDIYYQIHRPEQNLDRARTQLKLVRDMEEKWAEMKAIAESFL